MIINGNLVLGSTLLQRNRSIATITYDLKGCTITNQITTIKTKTSYTSTIVSDTAFTYCAAQILMGGKDITIDCYNILTGEINIPQIENNIIIRAEKLTTFFEASWFAVKNVAQSNILNNEDSTYKLDWKLGDTKPLVIGEYTYNVRICDLTPNRYQYVGNVERYSNMVLECVELLPDSRARHSSAIGNYNDNNIRQYYEEVVIPLLPEDLQKILNDVKNEVGYLTSATSSVSVGYSQNKLFMPSMKEVSGANESELGSIFQYYEIYTNSARQKKKITDNSYIAWWYRTGGYVQNNNSSYSRGQVGTFADANGNNSAITQTFTNANNNI